MKINLKLNKLKLIPYQCKWLLNKGYSVCMSPLYHVKTCYFLVFCVLEEFLLVVHGDDVILGLMDFLFVIYVICVMINWVAQIFYCCFPSYLSI